MKKLILALALLLPAGCASAATRYVMFKGDVPEARAMEITADIEELRWIVSATLGPQTTAADLAQRKQSLQRINNAAFPNALDAELAGASDLDDWVDRYMATKSVSWQYSGKSRKGAFHSYITLDVDDSIPPQSRPRIKRFIERIPEVRSVEAGP